MPPHFEAVGKVCLPDAGPAPKPHPHTAFRLFRSRNERFQEQDGFQNRNRFGFEPDRLFAIFVP